MRINVKEVINRKIDISDSEAREIVLKYIENKYGISPFYYKKSGSIVADIEIGVGSHSYFETIFKIKHPTTFQYALLKLVKEIHNENN